MDQRLEREVVVCYDVADNKNRRRLFEELKDIGLIPLQKSVFWGYVRTADQRAVQRAFRQHLDRSTDRAFICRTSLRDQIRHSAFGHKPADLLSADDSDVFLD